jgi:copper oxidase (laccase) domain-containing protein
VGGCTHTDAAHFFSHRRDNGRTGRHLSVIVASAPR